MSKFPERNMFQLTQDENDRLRSQNVTLKRGQYVKFLVSGRGEVLGFDEEFVDTLFLRCAST